MSAFQDPHMAESVGFNNGHALGCAQGMEAGYTNGWNEATTIGNRVISERDRFIQNLQAANASLEDANARLGAENAQLRQLLELQQEQSHSVRADYENMHKAFLGVVAIAGPAMQVVARQPLSVRDAFLTHYGDEAYRLQGSEYVAANRWPHNQPLVKQYLPAARGIIYAAIDEAKSQEPQPAAGHIATA